MGTIELEGMEFFAYHGCFKEEQKAGNYFNVNVSLDTDISGCEHSDNIADALNYQAVYYVVKHEMEITSHLLEHVVSRIINHILQDFEQAQRVTVKVSKINPPLGGIVNRVSVTQTKAR